MSDVVIASAVRTPIGAFMGGLAAVPAPELGALVVAEALRRAGVPAAQAIRAGDAEVVVAGGMENMSAAPHLLPAMRSGMRMGETTAIDSMLRDGLWCASCDVHMGVTAENVAAEDGITREGPGRVRPAQPAARRAGDRRRRLRRRDPARRRPGAQGGSGGGRSRRAPAPRHDARVPLPAAARRRRARHGERRIVVGDRRRRRGHRRDERPGRPRGGGARARVVRGHATVGVAPRVMGLGPVDAVRRALARVDVALADIDLIALNEAFAAQSLAACRRLGLDPDRTNVHGGAIVLGHPIGASGARVLTTLLHSMACQGARLGPAALCVGGGQGIAMVVERPATTA